MTTNSGYKIHITGIVQGVGFRPFVFGLATRYNLVGWVKNTAAGVDIEVDGSPEALEAFIDALKVETPPLGRIDSFEISSQKSQGYSSFQIVHSDSNPEDFIPISPDVSICPDCLQELFNSVNRRYHYPFTNCTNCGPRFTIIKDIPYDRPKTTMAEFPLCPDCRAEYNDPTNRRFHAQPVACSICGPKIWLEYPAREGEPNRTITESEAGQRIATDNILRESQQLLNDGKILAIKGLGGFHLACDATNPSAVRELRVRKLRVDKPFAVMMPDLAAVERHCHVSNKERELLLSRQRPIVILKRRKSSSIASEVAPGQDTLGVMLPYTPLHYLLFSDMTTQSAALKPYVYVMTSGNLSEEPIATENEEARIRLSILCDAFLMHDRPIRMRCDDSVVRVMVEQTEEDIPSHPNVNQRSLIFRRSRGFAPDPIRLPFEMPPILAVGPELKNTFCLVRGPYAFISHHIGDLENYETLLSFEDGIDHFERLFRIKPTAIAYDLHPNYMATRYALERAQREGLPTIGVQHHHAHIAACMAENGLKGDQPVIGVAFDGTGYGTDASIWGGEFLVSNYLDYQRAAHLKQILLPGGDTATRNPWRAALAWLYQSGIEWAEDLIPVKAANLDPRLGIETLAAIRHQLEHRVNTPLTSSIGRLFDAVAALVGVRQTVNYEAQAAIEFEAIADPGEPGLYPFEIIDLPVTDGSEPSYSKKCFVIDPAPLLNNLLSDFRQHVPQSILSARFHNGLAKMICDVLVNLRQVTGISLIALSGGVWQNITLLTKTVVLLQKSRFTVLLHHKVPPNDGGISLGQAVIGYTRLTDQIKPEPR